MTVFVAIVRFDNETNQILGKHKKAIKSCLSMDLTGEWPPHITLGVYEKIAEEALLAWGSEYAPK